jgi:hypothetical protein
MDPMRFTFDAEAVRVQSARQIVYRDRRAKPGDKRLDDVWIQRLQEAEEQGILDPTGDV